MAELYIPPWMRGTPMEKEYVDAYAETGSADDAIQVVQEGETYASAFAGNIREDGSLRKSEVDYLNIMESYANTLIGHNVNPDVFQDQMVAMFEGMTSPAEFETRVASVYSRIIVAIPEMAQFYADNYGINMNESSILASFLDPAIGDAIVSERLAISEVGAEAALRNFDIGLEQATQLQQYGIEGAFMAAEFFGRASNLIPTLSILAARHDDPDDDFDLTEFTAATILDDPGQRRRMRRLVAQEASTFTGGALVDYQRTQAGGVAGLTTQ